MKKSVVEGTSQWYVIHTHPKQEDRASNNLSILEIPIFNPKIKVRRHHQFMREPPYLIKPLFLRYIFAQFKIDELYQKVRFTRGVRAIVSFGGCPIPVDEEIISVIQSKVRKDGFVSIDEEIEPGDTVIIKDGPLKTFIGVFERVMKDTDRVRLLLETISYQAHVEIERELVKRIN